MFILYFITIVKFKMLIKTLKFEQLLKNYILDLWFVQG